MVGLAVQSITGVGCQNLPKTVLSNFNTPFRHCNCSIPESTMCFTTIVNLPCIKLPGLDNRVCGLLPWHWVRRGCVGKRVPHSDFRHSDTSSTPACPVTSTRAAYWLSYKCAPSKCGVRAQSSGPGEVAHQPDLTWRRGVHGRSWNDKYMTDSKSQSKMFLTWTWNMKRKCFPLGWKDFKIILWMWNNSVWNWWVVSTVLTKEVFVWLRIDTNTKI